MSGVLVVRLWSDVRPASVSKLLTVVVFLVFRQIGGGRRGGGAGAVVN